MTTANNNNNDVTLIKKYANRRLYDTGRSSYVTLSDLSEMVREGIDFKVVEAKSGEDITRSVLAQIVAEQESGTEEDGLMPTDFMKNLIGFYGENIQSMKGLMPTYLQSSMDTFVQNQEQVQQQWMKSFESMPGMEQMQKMQETAQKNIEKTLGKTMENMPNVPGMDKMQTMFGGDMTQIPSSIEDMTRKNMDMFQKTMTNTMKMFTPFGAGAYTEDDKKKKNG